MSSEDTLIQPEVTEEKPKINIKEFEIKHYPKDVIRIIIYSSINDSSKKAMIMLRCDHKTSYPELAVQINDAFKSKNIDYNKYELDSIYDLEQGYRVLFKTIYCKKDTTHEVFIWPEQNGYNYSEESTPTQTTKFGQFTRHKYTHKNQSESVIDRVSTFSKLFRITNIFPIVSNTEDIFDASDISYC